MDQKWGQNNPFQWGQNCPAKTLRSNIPSVYRLLDHERWDARAAERAAQRRAQREAEAARRKATAADEVAAQMRPGWPHGCGEGGRMDAARVAAWMRRGWPHWCGHPRRTSAAVPLLSKKVSLSEETGDASAQAGTAVTEERETPATPNNDNPAAVAAAWAAARGGRRNPAAEERVRRSAAVLLAADWPLADVVTMAEDMARQHPAWTDLGQHAQHWQAPAPAAPAAAAGSSSAAAPDWCGTCQGPNWRWVVQEDGREARCVDCNPHSAARAA